MKELNLFYYVANGAYQNKNSNNSNIEMAEDLILNGVDLVKVGIGNGSVCTTRIKTGVGYPQLSVL